MVNKNKKLLNIHLHSSHTYCITYINYFDIEHLFSNTALKVLINHCNFANDSRSQASAQNTTQPPYLIKRTFTLIIKIRRTTIVQTWYTTHLKALHRCPRPSHDVYFRFAGLKHVGQYKYQAMYMNIFIRYPPSSSSSSLTSSRKTKVGWLFFFSTPPHSMFCWMCICSLWVDQHSTRKTQTMYCSLVTYIRPPPPFQVPQCAAQIIAHAACATYLHSRSLVAQIINRRQRHV